MYFGFKNIKSQSYYSLQNSILCPFSLSKRSTLILAALVPAALLSSTKAKAVTIGVGHNCNPYFTSKHATADIGDMAEFVFDSKEHSVVVQRD